MRIPKVLMPHKVKLEAYNGASSTGSTFAVATVKPAFVEDHQQLVRDGNGHEVVSATRVFLNPEDFVPAGSRVTVWIGNPQERTATVIAAVTADNNFLAQIQLLLE